MAGTVAVFAQVGDFLILLAGAYASKFVSTPMQALISVLNLKYLSRSEASGPERADTITIGAGGGVVI